MAAKLRKRDCYGDGGGLLSLPEDIFLDVLLRLPSKDLYRLRCVSRSWRALISQPAIVAALRSRTTGTIILAMFGNQLRLLDKGGNVLMWFDVPGCKGLLVPTRLDRIFVDRGQFSAMIINLPSGRYFPVVGTNDIDPPLPSEVKYSPVISDYSFGRSAASGDYKVLRLATYLSHRWCQVATIRDDDAELTWRQRPMAPFYITSFSCEDKATINGILYFMLYYTQFHHRNFIAAFDLECEEWKPRMIEGPLLGHKNKDDRCRITLTELKGTLCLVHNVQYLADLVCHYADIWLLKDRISCVWVKEYKIKMMPHRLLLFTKPLKILLDGTLLLLNEYRKSENTKNCHRYMLQLYNASTKAFTDFMEMAPEFDGGIEPPILTCIRGHI